MINVDGAASGVDNVEDVPSVLTQIRKTILPEVSSSDPNSPFNFSPMSQGALLEIDQMECNAQVPGSSRNVNGISRVGSPDAFGDGDGTSLLDIMPGTPENIVETPRRSLKPVITSKRLTDTEARRPVESESLNGFQTAKEFVTNQKSIVQGQAKEPQSKQSMKRPSAGGVKDKKKIKINNQGPGGQGKKNKKKGKFKSAYTNRKAVKEMVNSATDELSLQLQDLSFMSTEKKLKLSSWGLPNSILNVRCIFFCIYLIESNICYTSSRLVWR